ncbi:MAG TPA: hypothetical protein VEU51_14615 [Candidatus Acidoferrales bacterium]|nr:hypothetical protein [Candidatus Acidoferrales bacterium]
MILLWFALAAGGYLRFSNLGRLEMSPDEGASWGAASATTVAEVVARQARLNPGKLPIHDLMLHGWIMLFGDSLPAMRSLSALLGTVSILLVCLVTRELLESADDDDRIFTPDEVAFVAATAAALFAVSIVTIKYTREARMYAVMLAAALAQVAMFLRALRRGGVPNCVAVAILTAATVGSNFSAVLLPMTEALWLIYAFAQRGWRFTDAAARRTLAVALALGAGCVALAPKLFSSFGATTAGTAGGIIRWIKPPPLYAPFALFNKAIGSFAFPVIAALAIWGVVRGWQIGARDAVRFALLWMWAPPLIMMLASYTLTPIFVERYALTCFVPFFILAALGISELPTDFARIGALALAVLLSAGHIVSYDRKPHDAQWQEAVAAADAESKPGELIGVAPAYAVEVARYYLPPPHRDRAVRRETGALSAAVLIVGQQSLHPAAAEAYRREFPQVVAELRGVTVRRK